MKKKFKERIKQIQLKFINLMGMDNANLATNTNFNISKWLKYLIKETATKMILIQIRGNLQITKKF